MALLDLYLDLQTKRLVFSETNGRTVALPELHREDSFTIGFRALKRIRTIGTPLFQRVNLAAYSLTISIGSADTPLAQASSFVISDSDTLLTGTLNMSTAGINALADGASSIFEIKLSSAGEPYRAQFPVVIRKSVATSGSITQVISDVALGINEADRTYVRHIGRAGEAIILVSDDGLKQAILRVDNDGSCRFEPIT